VPLDLYGAIRSGPGSGHRGSWRERDGEAEGVFLTLLSGRGGWSLV